MSRVHCRVTHKEAYNHQFRMLDKGRRLAKFLPGFRLLGVDPGYLFTRTEGRGSIDLPSDVVDALLEALHA